MGNAAGEEVKTIEDVQTDNVSQNATLLYSVTGQTPWWIVSIILHGLVITLAGLISMVIETPNIEDYGVPVTEILKPMESNHVEVADKSPRPQDNPLNKPSNGDDVNGIDMIITENILAQAIVGEEFRTINQIKYEVDGAHGVQDSNIFYRTDGLVDPAGGGGTSGIGFEDAIGVGGTGTQGKGTGFGGGEGDGIGTGRGNGKGQFGFPDRGSRELMVKRHNKNPHITEDSVNIGLQWLAYHQEPDGRWDAKKYGAGPKTDTAVTGLALLAFLGAGHSEKVGSYASHIRKAVAWLKSKQAADGSIWDTTDDNAHHRKMGYHNAIATMAIVEAAAMSNVSETKIAAQKAIDYCTQIHQCGDGSDKGGWRYGAKEEGDLSVTGWYIMALKSAKVARLNVPSAAFAGAMSFLESVEVREPGKDGYGLTRYKYMKNNEHANTAHRLTAIGTLARQFTGSKKEELQGSVDWFVAKGGTPQFGFNGESVDLYYWYYGSLCTFQQGGDVWKRWNADMVKALVGSQAKEGDDAGSWNPVGEFSGEWGRVGQTALSALCLEVYYRYSGF
jgi:hypothetical protein